MENYKGRYADSARREVALDGSQPSFAPGHFFLRCGNHVDLFLKDHLFLDCAAEIVSELAGIARLEGLWINSPGGFLVDAKSVHDSLKGKTPLCVIHNLCASSAMLVAFAADRILIDRQAVMACHPAITAVIGNSWRLRKTALELDAATEQVMQAVQNRTGKTADEIRSWFNPERDMYFTAEQAVAVGLADGFWEVPSVPAVA
jgi:ATP-dependent protease ClpP protease subunit